VADDRLDARRAPRPAAFVGVDVALLTVMDGGLGVLLVRRSKSPYAGDWSLPGVFMRPQIDLSLGQAAERALEEKLGIRGDVQLEQLGTWHSVGRDPRGWVVSVVYYAMLSEVAINRYIALAKAVAALVPIKSCDSETMLDFRLLGRDGSGRGAFDHEEIVRYLVRSIRDDAGNAMDLAFKAIETEFALKSLQHAYEAVRGRRVNKDSFRRAMVTRGYVVPVNKWEKGVGHRPAQLFRRSSDIAFA
jgi:ADP-ribose pyrophosphatase YjhB (NUDIX family)